MFRFLRRTRHTTAAPSIGGVAVVDVSAFPDRHTERCAQFATVAQPLGPLVTEMIALHTHTRHLAWLSEREHCPDSYQLLARSIVREVLAGWHHQTDGRGTIEDLLSDDTRRARRPRVPEQEGAPASESAAHRGPEDEDAGRRPPAPATWWSQKTFEADDASSASPSAVSDSGPVSREPDLGASELAESTPRQDATSWWSHARGQQ
ncbi:hypothetical protein Stsp01_64750 [Streptomyces sp. NBRC 13847]|uniref:hypothetical protein n=1 Tax=Streptomyces TaxID=1883 RepID=UPI0024A0744C|nr:hypothetical protein [Streptomyces sp. NBRC 13847]GLW19732.1 hypothetical protein Stsp01_64750 [Streptomyces sp. NBRC 13847]